MNHSNTQRPHIKTTNSAVYVVANITTHLPAPLTVKRVEVIKSNNSPIKSFR